MNTQPVFHILLLSVLVAFPLPLVGADDIGQPLGANAVRLVEALDYLGAPLPDADRKAIQSAARHRDTRALQELLDPHVLVIAQINPELRVKVERGDAPARLRQNGFTPVIVKVLNDATVSDAH